MSTDEILTAIRTAPLKHETLVSLISAIEQYAQACPADTSDVCIHLLDALKAADHVYAYSEAA